jgi:hypothetical protein
MSGCASDGGAVSIFDDLTRANYSAARFRATFRKLLDLLSGHRRELLSFEEVQSKLHLGGFIYRGIQTIPLVKIVGSVNRYKDFDQRFLPTSSSTAERWKRINTAWYKEESFPPVVLYKVGELYFVVDGNHRVSVARSHDQKFIDAEVRECDTRVPIGEDFRPEDLERLEAQVEFLKRTQLDKILPGVKIETTLLGGYERLIEHIAVHRYFMGLDEGRHVTEKKAILHWYEALYRPVVEVLEQSGILEDFPGRTATDLYLWIMDHLHYLRSQQGAEEVRPEDAAQDFVERKIDTGKNVGVGRGDD